MLAISPCRRSISSCTSWIRRQGADFLVPGIEISLAVFVVERLQILPLKRVDQFDADITYKMRDLFLLWAREGFVSVAPVRQMRHLRLVFAVGYAQWSELFGNQLLITGPVPITRDASCNG